MINDIITTEHGEIRGFRQNAHSVSGYYWRNGSCHPIEAADDAALEDEIARIDASFHDQEERP